MRTWAVVIVIALSASLVASPVVASDHIHPAAADVTLYFHLDAHQDFPINTQPPDDRFASDDGLGLTGVTTSCIPDPGLGLGMVSQSLHTFYGFSTPGPVEYGVTEDGGPRIHPERGLAEDVRLETGWPATLHWYVETRPLGGADFTGTTHDAPFVVPQVQVLATLRTGDDVSAGADAYEAGQVIASGASAVETLRPGGDGHQTSADGANVYAFAVPLSFAMDTIPGDEAFNVRVDVRLLVPGCDEDPDAAVMASNVRVHTSPDWRPRLEWGVRNPVYVEEVVPRFRDGTVLVEVAVNSPWGNYDVDPQRISVDFRGPSDAVTTSQLAFQPPPGVHGHHTEPLTGGFVWWYALDEADEGEYTVTVHAENLQGTGVGSATARFVIGPDQAFDQDGAPVPDSYHDGDNGSPGPGTFALVGVLAAAFVARRLTR